MHLTSTQFLQKPTIANCYIVAGSNEFLSEQIIAELTKQFASFTKKTIYLHKEKDCADLSMQLIEQDLFATEMWFDIIVDKKITAKTITKLITAIANSAKKILLRGHTEKLIQHKSCQELINGNATILITSDANNWFPKWLDWQLAELSLVMPADIKSFVCQEAHESPLFVQQWLARIAIVADSLPYDIQSTDLQSLPLYHQQQEVGQIISSALLGKTEVCITRINALSQNGKDFSGMFIFQTSRFIYMLINAKKQSAMSYNSGFSHGLYLPANCNVALKALSHELDWLELHGWLQQLVDIDKSHKGGYAMPDKWLLITTLYLDVCLSCSALSK